MRPTLNLESLEKRTLMTATLYADLSTLPNETGGNEGSQLLFAPSKFVVNDRLIYATKADELGLQFDLWADDGQDVALLAEDLQTPSPFSPIVDLVEFESFSLGERGLFFVSKDLQRTDPNQRNVVRQTWVTDGTAEGTKILDESADRFLHSRLLDRSDPTSLDSRATAIVFGEDLLFENTSEEAGSELWTTDGTEAGTGLLKDLSPGAADASPTDFHVANGLAYFTVGGRLWQSDGTTGGTVEISEAVNRTERSIELNEFGSKIVFVERLIGGNRLMLLDPTSGAIAPIADLPETIANVRVIGERIFFTSVSELIEDGSRGVNVRSKQ